MLQGDGRAFPDSQPEKGPFWSLMFEVSNCSLLMGGAHLFSEFHYNPQLSARPSQLHSAGIIRLQAFLQDHSHSEQKDSS